MSGKEISNTDDIIDSRDIIERIEELEAEREPLAEAVKAAIEAHNDCIAKPRDERDAAETLRLGRVLGAAWSALNDFDAGEEGEELKVLKAFAKQGEDYFPDWKYGEELIRDSYFETYAQELADDLGANTANASWPYTCIDWEQAARELQMDYTALDFGGVTYWAR